MNVLYFGIYDPHFGRNSIYIQGLKELGVRVIECRDDSKGFLKYVRLWQKHRSLQEKYDALIVGYPGHLVVPFAKLIARGPVVADFLGSLRDAEEYSHASTLWRRMKSSAIDRLAICAADKILLESEAQKRFFERTFGPSPKYEVLYTGVHNAFFFCDPHTQKDHKLVLFRGRLTPESGILHILKAAILTKDKGVRFRIVGFGLLLEKAQAFVREHALSNVELITKNLSAEEIRAYACSASLALGQIEDTPRLSRTIPHKAFEAFAMGIPYLSGDGEAVREIVRDNETGFLVPLADPEALAKCIVEVLENETLRQEVAKRAYALYRDRFTPNILARALIDCIKKTVR